MRRRRMVVIKWGMWRTGRIGDAFGSVTLGMADPASCGEERGPEGGMAVIKKP
jgi:hypothetical protein